MRRLRYPRNLLGAALVAVVGLGAGACGGGSDKGAAVPTTTPTTVTIATAPTLPPGGNDQAGTPFCKLAVTYADKFNVLASSLNDPAKLKAASTDAESAIRQARETAPAEVKADVSVVAATAAQLLTALQKANFVYANTPPADVAKLQDPTFQASLTKLLSFGRAHCGMS